MRKLFLCVLATTVLFFSGCAKKVPSTPMTSSPPSIVSRTGPIQESDLGVPLYPGAVPAGDKSFIFNGKGNGTTPPVKTIGVTLTTSDSVDQVESFYRQKLSSGAVITDQVSKSGKLVNVEYKKGNLKAEIQIVPQASGNGAVIVVLSQIHS
jgi:hypothetical protein